jgi:hypothetical protein
MSAAITERFINPYLEADHRIRTSVPRPDELALAGHHDIGIDAAVRLIAPQ